MSDKIDLIKGIAQNAEHTIQRNVEESSVSTFIGEALGDDEKINCLMATSKPEITVLVGFAKYGKTSFIASCYHILLTEGKVGDYTFYDSDTLTGFERRVYLRRISEKYKEITPTTKRTIRGEPHLLTFRFSHPEQGEKVVVISDHSGEDYLEYRNRKEMMEKDILLKNADRMFFFVDCEMLVNNSRLKMQNEYSQLIQNMHETSSFREGVKVQFLFNKHDLVKGKEGKYNEEKSRFLSKMEEVLHLPLGDSLEIVANNVDNESVGKLLLDIVQNTKPTTQKDCDLGDLDWVKTMLK